MDWKSSSSNQDESIQVPPTWLHLHYYEALNVLFRVENALRVLVYVALKEEYAGTWDQLAIEGDNGTSTVAKIAKQRGKQAQSFGYLGYPVTSPLLFLTSGELLRLITAESYWNIFRPYFIGSKSVVKTKLEEIISVRNALAHFRPIRADDVETVKQAAKHVLSHGENVLHELITCLDTVPTNTDEEWYIQLQPLGTNLLSLRFKQSTDRIWVKIVLNFTPLVSKGQNFFDSHWKFKTLKLNASAIIASNVKLRENVIYVTEHVPYLRFGSNGLKVAPKTVSLGFSRAKLAKNFTDVRHGLENLLHQVSEEAELIQQDGLARGKLVRAVAITGRSFEGKKWGVADGTGLKSEFSEGDPVEWWGEMSFVENDVISSITTFPWMPTDVSKADLPF